MDFLKKYAGYIVIIILGIILNVSIIVSSQESTTMDEQAHIPAAYTYVKYNDMRLNPEHPPLLKDLAGIPLQFLNVKFPADDPGWINGINEQWNLGNKFIHSNNAEDITFWSRLPIILIALLLGFFIYKWTRELAGAAAGLLALVLYAFDPNILGHNHYVTTDLGIAAFIFISFYYFIKFIKNPGWKNTILAGIFLGLAELVKFSAVLLFPFFALVIIIYAIFKKKPDPENSGVLKYKLKKFGEYVWKYAVIVVVCFVLIWILYQYNTFNMPAEKIRVLAQSAFGGEETLPRLARNTVTAMSANPVLKPLSEYFLGVFMVFARVEGGNTYYLFGHVSNQATAWYFPAVFLLKETIPFLLLILFTGGYTVYNLIRNIFRKTCHSEPALAGEESRNKKTGCNITGFLAALGTTARNYLQTGVAYYAMLGFILLYSYLSITGNLNIGFRHLFPILPFAYILVAKKISDFFRNIKNEHTKNTLKIILAIIIVWVILEPIIFFPSYISYFNEFAGGPRNGYKYVTDSNLDWGQDLKRLHNWVNDYNLKHPANQIDKIHIDYFGGSNPTYYFGDKSIPWHGEYGPAKGWLAISATFLQESIHKQKKPGEKSYEWLLNCQPFARVGDSIFIYYVP